MHMWAHNAHICAHTVCTQHKSTQMHTYMHMHTLSHNLCICLCVYICILCLVPCMYVSVAVCLFTSLIAIIYCTRLSTLQYNKVDSVVIIHILHRGEVKCRGQSDLSTRHTSGEARLRPHSGTTLFTTTLTPKVTQRLQAAPCLQPRAGTHRLLMCSSYKGQGQGQE